MAITLNILESKLEWNKPQSNMRGSLTDIYTGNFGSTDQLLLSKDYYRH